MKNRLMDYSDLDFYYQQHIKKVDDVYDTLRKQLIDQYVKEGFWEGFAVVKANNDILALRSKPKNVHTLNIPPEQTTQGDLD